MERTGNRQNDKFHVKQSSKQQLVYGLRPVIEAIESGVQIDKILIQNGLSGNLVNELKSKIRAAGLPFQYVPIEKLDKVTRNNHQGVVATVSPIEYQQFMDLIPMLFEQGKTPFVVLLDHITDVRNMGAIVRTAECAGVDAVVVPDRGSAQMSEDAIKTSSGALLRVPICREQNLKTVINFAKQIGLQVVAATEKGSKQYTEVDFKQPTLLVMGSEETGISNEVLRLCDVRAKLPIMGEVQSLNVGVAAGVFMYEVLRQRATSNVE
ncbi:MAG: 23S rRNA (guanosine(2251)-2'-O)-methyltransferase RlmB [Bacteroidales bacterium]|nr:23S rRNA (guanosine(2251)-2'-O)-methyltransferase RlmB [Bacteroidales bacterium]